MEIRFTHLEEKKIVKDIFIKKWNSDVMISRGQKHFVDDLEIVIAIKNDNILGILTFNITNNQAEIVSLDSFEDGKGIGSKLLDFALNYFRNLELNRIWLITSNDNCHAIRFYQKRGWEMVNIHLNAISDARKIKPEIPLIGYDDIPILHEIEFEFYL